MKRLLRWAWGRARCFTGHHEWIITDIDLREISITSDGTFALGGYYKGPVLCAYCAKDRP